MLKRTWLVFVASIALSLVALSIAAAQAEPTQTPGDNVMAAPIQTGYASVNDLEMYYEIHGTDTGTPLVVLHGAYMSIVTMGEIIPRLAETRQVIAVELQGHGRTNDVEGRALSYEQMADDVAALLGEINVAQADFFGYSMGGSTALQVAIRHPEVVRKLVVASATYTNEGWYPDLHAMISTITPEMFAGSPMETDYQAIAPNPENFATLVEKLVQLDTSPQDWTPESLQSITAPTFFIAADSDAVTPEHMIEMFKLRGGGVNGDLAGMPEARLAIIPGTTHTSVLYRVDWLVPMITEFLDAQPAPAPQQ